MKLTPDELAEAVKKIITENDDTLREITFETLYGTHSYRTIVVRKADGTGVAVFMG